MTWDEEKAAYQTWMNWFQTAPEPMQKVMVRAIICTAVLGMVIGFGFGFSTALALL